MTSRDQCLTEEHDSPQPVDDIPGSSSATTQRTDLQTLTEINAPGRDSARSPSTSDDELLIPGNLSRLKNCATDSSAQSIILVAGTSVDSSVLLNPPPRGHFDDDSVHSDDACNISNPPGDFRTNLRNENFDDDELLVLDSCSDSGLETIFPKQLSEHNPPRNAQNGLNIDQNLLNYPLISVEESGVGFTDPLTIHINPGSLLAQSEVSEVQNNASEDEDTRKNPDNFGELTMY